MRYILLLVLTACRTLAPPPDDIDAYCRGRLRENPLPVPPECTETAERLLMAASRAPEPPETLSNGREKARVRANDCRLDASLVHIGPGLIEAVSGVPAQRRSSDDDAYCEQQMRNAWDICRAKHGGR